MKGLLQFLIFLNLLHVYQPLQFQRRKIIVHQERLKSMQVISTTQNEKTKNLFLNVGDFFRKTFPDEKKVTVAIKENLQSTIPAVSKIEKPRVVAESNNNNNDIEVLLWTGITGIAFLMLVIESSKYFFPLALLLGNLQYFSTFANTALNYSSYLGTYQVLRSTQPSSQSKVQTNNIEELVALTHGSVRADNNFDLTSSTKRNTGGGGGSSSSIIISNESSSGKDSYEKLELNSNSVAAVEIQQQR